MAIVNANYEFILRDFRTNGRILVRGIIENNTFYDKLKKQQITYSSYK